MEQLIILIVMLALSSLFGKKKKNPEEQKPMSEQRPIHTQTKKVEPERTNKPRSLKDLSRDLFEDIQKEFKDLQTEIEEPKQQAPQTEVFYPSQPKPQQQRPAKPASPARAERSERQPSRGRLHSERSTVVVDDSRILQEDLIPKTSKQVLQGIVYSEILGPPKAKR
ncbi:hypothetical protein ORD22_06675 [Sporosarcina sp. GW1-11]|uniref:hypothetical protein n=1 Tax=Sporosarcina sp. GW1-11 TaxID=2899126 RepID=UPI00294E5F88|nr:hypothetical protein [Sporosarcina sp. GW1-11]MDV6377946.1 hypothetical protein [Sporosarcina sp. GW1-11]